MTNETFQRNEHPFQAGFSVFVDNDEIVASLDGIIKSQAERTADALLNRLAKEHYLPVDARLSMRPSFEDTRVDFLISVQSIYVGNPWKYLWIVFKQALRWTKWRVLSK